MGQEEVERLSQAETSYSLSRGRKKPGPGDFFTFRKQSIEHRIPCDDQF